MTKSCALCGRPTEEENSAILTMGAYANPRYLCADCESLITEAEEGEDYESVKAALDRLSEYIGVCKDMQAIDALGEILKNATERADRIQDGTYDFSGESASEEEDESAQPTGDYEETEEDKALDERDAERDAKFNKVLNWVWVVILAGAAVWLVIRLLRTFGVL